MRYAVTDQGHIFFFGNNLGGSIGDDVVSGSGLGVDQRNGLSVGRNHTYCTIGYHRRNNWLANLNGVALFCQQFSNLAGKRTGQLN